MKRLILAAVLIISFCTASFAKKIVAEGKTFSALGDYKIEALDEPVILNGKNLEGFTVSYQNTDMKVTIAIEKTRKYRNYYVLSDNLSIQYVCNNDYLGVERLSKDLEKEGYKTSNEALNNEQYYHQRKIASGGKTDMENTNLIAAFFPLLLKDTEGMQSTN